MTELERSRIRELLQEMQSSGSRVFGADEHHFLLNPPLPEAEVAAFERYHRIILPSDYRHFITHIGNGGAGPFYGIFPLGQREGQPWHEDDGFVGVLSRPFPHREAWNDLPGRPSEDLYETDPDEAERQLIAFDKLYYDSSWVNGAIPICHQGCAIRVWLVVAGEEAGHLWLDDRASDGGISPLELKNGARATFSSWYYEWLTGPLIL